MAEHACLVCGAPAVRMARGFDRLRRVGSDCRPWPGGTRVGVCEADGTVQKILDERWHRDAAAIYSDYALYHQSATGAEVMVFDQGSGIQIPRSQRFLSYVMSRVHWPSAGRMLDVGCGTGATLRAFSDLAPAWSLFGLEPNLKNADEIKSITGVTDVFDGYLTDVGDAFDLITVIHTLEHLEDPRGFLDDVRHRLTKDGLLVIQVPYFPRNPFDLLVVDHSAHHTASGLLRLLGETGFSVVAASNAAVPKEMTVVARPAAMPPTPMAGRPPARIADAVDTCAAWLGDVLDGAREVAARGRFGLFGTGIAANWLLGELDPAVEFFVDEDASRAGTRYHDRPVYHPDRAPVGGNVFVVLPSSSAADIADRLSTTPAVYHRPPPWTPVLDESDLFDQTTA